jgi:uncharacterized protein YkwD
MILGSILTALLSLTFPGIVTASTVLASTPLSNYQSSRYFPATGYSVRGVFLQFFDRHGGVRVFGYPVSGEVIENGLLVQYFERQRFEYHRELAGTPYEVQLSNLGAMLGRGKVSFAPVRPFASKPGRAYFSETGHSLSNPFLAFWKANGGVRIFGYPVSEPVAQGGALVQYFERARMEYHPNKPHLGVQLGLLGREYLQANPHIAAAIYRDARAGISRGGERMPTELQQVGQAQRAPSAQVHSLNEREKAMLDYINGARRSAGISPVSIESALTTVARSRSTDMASRGYFSHTTPEGSTYMALLKAAGISFKYSGEIIAYNSYPAEQAASVAYDTFMKSPAHRSIMLDGRYNLVGVGEARDSRGHFYYTVIFIQR